MVKIDAEFTPATIPEDEVYEGTKVDPNVLALLPYGCTVKWAATHGASFWAISHKIIVELSDGEEKSYFLKVYMHESGQEMAMGEYESTKIWHSYAPKNVPQPIGTGECADRPGKYFCLLEFLDMSDDMPAASDFVSLVAQVHQKSQSPTGKFGFHIKTFAGDHPYINDWCDTWEEYFTRLMVGTMERELSIQGPHAELEALNKQIIEKVIPRLLRPMESGGRTLKPSLVHGDLWHGNVGVDNETDGPILYDCGSFYGHNEYDFGMWRAARYRTNKPHLRAYYRVAEITAPVEDQDDRNALYAARNDLAVSICWPANKRMRSLAIEEFKRLVNKYPNGYDDFVDTDAVEKEVNDAAHSSNVAAVHENKNSLMVQDDAEAMQNLTQTTVHETVAV